MEAGQEQCGCAVLSKLTDALCPEVRSYRSRTVIRVAPSTSQTCNGSATQPGATPPDTATGNNRGQSTCNGSMDGMEAFGSGAGRFKLIPALKINTVPALYAGRGFEPALNTCAL